MPTLHKDQLRFPTGLTVRRVKQRAKELKKESGMSHRDALDVVAAENGVDLPWPEAIQFLQDTNN